MGFPITGRNSFFAGMEINKEVDYCRLLTFTFSYLVGQRVALQVRGRYP